MTTIICKIKDDLDAARKNQDKAKLQTLILLYAEVAKEGKKKNRETLDSEAIGVLKSFQANLELCISVSDNQEFKDKHRIELKVVKEYIPEQLTRKDLENLVGQIWLNQAKPTLGVIMKYFKEIHGGLYDGTELKSVVDEYLKPE